MSSRDLCSLMCLRACLSFTGNVLSATLSGRIEPLNGSSLTYSGGTFTNNGQVVVTATNTVRLTSTGAHVTTAR